jgi:hypothetical protein
MDYERTLTKSYEESLKKKKKAGKGVAQLGQQAQSVPSLFIGNQYGSNLGVLKDIPGEVPLDQLEAFFKDSGLNLAQMFGGADIPSAPEVDTWKIYKYAKSLYNPVALSELGTQMYLLNKWYIEACGRKEMWIQVRIRNHRYFRGDDIIFV